MKFDPPPRREPGESIVPMINVVFLLLIFFLMTAEIVPPAPFEVTPPTAESGEPGETRATVYVDAEGRPGFADMVGDGALAALAAEYPPGGAEPVTLTIRADGTAPGVRVAALLRELGGLGYDDVTLVTAAP